jgi:hypothetical protein
MEFLRNPDQFAATVRVLATQMHSRTGEVPELWQGTAQ